VQAEDLVEQRHQAAADPGDGRLADLVQVRDHGLGQVPAEQEQQHLDLFGEIHQWWPAGVTGGEDLLDPAHDLGDLVRGQPHGRLVAHRLLLLRKFCGVVTPIFP
jgi:hypothetical protein